ncbi:Uncharacterised protein [uncultured Clostridium sp.]|nr:Uncharacterised protein [uncultured Clostridium sp.]
MYKKIGIIVLILVLALGNVYFYTKIDKLDYDIIIGTTVIGENSDIAINFSKSKPISNKDDFNSIVFSLMDSVSIDKPKICENPPDSVITFNDRKDGIQYYTANIWINNNSLIIKSNGNESTYKIIEADRAQEIIKIIKKYITKIDK